MEEFRLHECLVPVMIIENPIDTGLVPKIKSVKWVNLKCAVETENAGDGYSIDIRTKFNDANHINCNYQKSKK